jgi:glycosyltransferase involved in cell wall biosynthesis
MTEALLVLGIATALELLLAVPLVWKARAVLVPLILVLLIIGSGWALYAHPMFVSYWLVVIAAYRALNLLRIIKNRMHPQYLYRVVTRTSAAIIGLQIISVAIWYICSVLALEGSRFWIYFNILQAVCVIIIFLSTERHLRTTLPPVSADHITDKELPTLTVAIPARNETEDLQTCLETLTASDYPKLEIIVLDDCSQNSRTPEIIRGFAQKGVRFLQGEDIKPNWLAKNQAYQQLLDAASGDYILFAGVDTRFEPESLRRLVESVVHKNKSMISVIPSNKIQSLFSQSESILLQPVRYAWEISLPRKMFNRPPVLSTCWIIQRKTLQSAGGFAAVSRSIVPESYFARVCAVHDGYSFMQSNEYIGVKSHKATPLQLDTAIRTRYPQLHRRPELVLLISVVEVFGLLLPFYFLGLYLVRGVGLLTLLLTLFNCVLILMAFGRVVCLTYRSFMFRAFLLAPLAVVADLIILNLSMYRYEFSEVIWKGRNVCIPVMHVIPKLPQSR